MSLFEQPTINIPLDEGPHQTADAKVERRMYATMTRGDLTMRVLVGGGSKLERIRGALDILKWNRLGRKWAKETGNHFPLDAPVSIRQVNWKSVLQKGNV